MTKTQQEYREFEETLLKTFKNKIPNSKDQLKFKMNEIGFRNKKITDKNGRSYVDHNFPISKKQENYAWEFLQKQGEQQRLKVSFHYYIEKGHKSRALENIHYNNRTYRKGQFLPKEILNENS